MLQIGQIVGGRYKIVSKIGQGGMSVVYLGMNEKANQPWAIKEVRKEGVKDFESVKQGLIVETEMLKRLKHDHLPRIVDVIDADDTFLIVMDYVEGRTLADVLKEATKGGQIQGGLPQEHVIEWAKQLCDVLGYLHQSNPPIIYRDMKPSNVMLQPDGKIKLIDFGTAREFKERNIADTTCLGTIGFAPPEQFGGHGQTDGRTDIFALGATMYHLVTGKSPAEPPYKIYPIRHWNPSLSSGLEKIILKCTQQNPVDRYQSCAELMYDLNNYARLDETYRRKRKRRLAIFSSIACASIVFALAGVAALALQSGETTSQFEAYTLAAENTEEFDEKLMNYFNAIEKKPEDADTYLKIIEAYTDMCDQENIKYDDSEDSRLRKILNDDYLNKILEKQPKKYIEICYEAGRLMLFYGKGENVSANSNVATIFFKKILDKEDLMKEYGEEEIVKTAQTFNTIGTFKAEFNKGNGFGMEDKDKPKELFNDTFSEWFENRNNDEDTSTMEKLSVYREVLDSMNIYASFIYGDGTGNSVSSETISMMMNAIVDGMEEIKSPFSLNDSNITPVEKLYSELCESVRVSWMDTSVIRSKYQNLNIYSEAEVQQKISVEQ